jgi:glycosyltransferase involved in cell wall biosynthesis
VSQPLRVLVVHNRYRSTTPSGENRSVDEEIDQLRDAGVEVVTYLAESDAIADYGLRDKLALPLRPTHSRSAVRGVERLLEGPPVDLVHVENVYPLLSPSVMSAVRGRGIPVVHSVRSYRHWCMAATFYRDGHVCLDCPASGTPLPGVVHGCFHDSRAQSAAVAMAQFRHRRTVHELDRYLPVSEFVARHLRARGVPSARITVKPNSVVDPGPASPPGRDVVFVGRLGPEKGLSLLLDAWDRAGLVGRRLLIAGDGPERGLAAARAAQADDVIYLGQVAGGAVEEVIDRAGWLMVPSLWHEPFGRVVLEAFAKGRPVVATARGGLSELVDDSVGRLVRPTVEAMTAALQSLDHADLAALGAAARRRYEQGYTPKHAVAVLLDAYRETLDVGRLSRRTPSST